jgi:hypothetical protein
MQLGRKTRAGCTMLMNTCFENLRFEDAFWWTALWMALDQLEYFVVSAMFHLAQEFSEFSGIENAICCVN